MSEGLLLSQIRGGTGSASLAPPWSRDQVRWLGKGYYILRLATEETSRWLIGAGFLWNDVLPHERTFRRSAFDKCALMGKLRMNPWPVHLVCDANPVDWRSMLSSVVEGKAAVFDTGHVTLWRVSGLPRELSLKGPCIVLDGHHSRRAQMSLGLRRMLGWLEPINTPQLCVRSIDRGGWLAKWLNELLDAGELRKLGSGPDSSQWTMGSSQAFEVVQASSRWWCEVAKPCEGEAAIDAIGRLAKGKAFLKATANFEELLGWIERFEVDTGLRLPPPTKVDVRTRAHARHLLPQKATYFFPKVPFGVLVEDLK